MRVGEPVDWPTLRDKPGSKGTPGNRSGEGGRRPRHWEHRVSTTPRRRGPVGVDLDPRTHGPSSSLPGKRAALAPCLHAASVRPIRLMSRQVPPSRPERPRHDRAAQCPPCKHHRPRTQSRSGRVERRDRPSGTALLCPLHDVGTCRSCPRQELPVSSSHRPRRSAPLLPAPGAAPERPAGQQAGPRPRPAGRRDQPGAADGVARPRGRRPHPLPQQGHDGGLWNSGFASTADPGCRPVRSGPASLPAPRHRDRGGPPVLAEIVSDLGIRP